MAPAARPSATHLAAKIDAAIARDYLMVERRHAAAKVGRMQEIDDDIPTVLGTPARQVPAAELARRIESALAEPLPKHRLSVAYLLAVVAVGGTAAALPFLYLLIPVGLGVGAWLWGATWIPGVRGWFSGVWAVAPAVGMAAAALSIASPLFSRRMARSEQPIVVTPQSEPLLFHLIQGVARAVGVRAPGRVHLTLDCNAGVRLHEPIVLEIGLSLVSVLSIAQLAGVLAHELGHVKQGWARRFLLRVVRVHAWFDEVVQDVEHQQPGEGLAGLIQDIALAVGLRVLSLVLWVSVRVVRRLARQMELDADRYEASLVGHAAATETLENLTVGDVIVFETKMLAAAGETCPNNLPRWVALQLGQVSSVQRRRLARTLNVDAAGVPHPSFEVRAAHARRYSGPGLRGLDAPAIDILRSFDSYAERVTADGLVPHLSHGARLSPNADQLARGERS